MYYGATLSLMKMTWRPSLNADVPHPYRVWIVGYKGDNVLR
jgi:hypothetical protein